MSEQIEQIRAITTEQRAILERGIAQNMGYLLAECAQAALNEIDRLKTENETMRPVVLAAVDYVRMATAPNLTMLPVPALLVGKVIEYNQRSTTKPSESAEVKANG